MVSLINGILNTHTLILGSRGNRERLVKGSNVKMNKL